MQKNTEKNLTRPFFGHDVYEREDRKIKRLLFHFRKEDEMKAKAALLIYWWIVEDMHKDDYKVKDLEIYAEDYKCEPKLLKSILEDFELFRKENECYVSDRVLRNLEYLKSKSEQGAEAAETRWLLSSFNKHYKEIFGESPVLNTDEIKALKNYNKSIADFRTKLPDILFTLKHLKFDNDINFKPCVNWLLKNNNLARLINGEFGKLKHKKTESELKDEQAKMAAQKSALEKPTELQIRIDSICNKADAIELINNYREKIGTKTIIPPLKTLMKKFDIKEKELG